MQNNDIIPTGLPGGFFIYTASGQEQILWADGNVIALFGCTTMEEFLELTGGSFKGMVHPDDLPKIENNIQSQTMYGEKRHDYVRYRIVTKDGGIRYIEDFGHLMHSTDGTGYFYVFIIDVEQDEFFNRARNSFAEAQIFAQNVDADQLTGLYNMPQFYQTVQTLISDRTNRQKGITFIHFDIANFKLFNERYGFTKGDELLCQVARIIRQTFPEHMVARFSNDHFVVCTYQRDVAERIEEIHRKVQHVIEGSSVELKAGVYPLQDNVMEVGIACDHARLACNSIKKRYDINYCFYDPTQSKKLRQQQYIVDHLDEAIKNEYIKVYYQPVIRVSTGEICGYEALSRWIDPVQGMLSPLDFIETLEHFHLIHKLDSFVVKRVCQDYQELLQADEPIVPVSINLSRMDFQLCNIFDVVESYRKQYKMPREMLDIEITESALSDNSEFMKKEVVRFHEAGYQIWIDDFGSGYSSLNVLTDFVFDLLKLDMKFLRSFDHNPKAGTLIYYIAYAAQELGLQSLSEGVETEAHFEFLKKIGCNKAQGYLFGKPLPLAETRAQTSEKGLTWEQP